MLNFASLQIHCYVSGGPWALKVTYYLDGDYAQTLSTKTYSAAESADVTVRAGVLSSYFEIQAINYTTSALSMDLVVTPDNTPTPAASYQGAVSGDSLAGFASETIAAGASQAEVAFQIYEGLCYLNVGEANGPGWYASIEFWDDVTQAWTICAQLHSQYWSYGNSIPVCLPSSQVRVTVYNQTTKSDTFMMSLLPVSG